jgi:hypothetical protein
MRVSPAGYFAESKNKGQIAQFITLVDSSRPRFFHLLANDEIEIICLVRLKLMSYKRASFACSSKRVKANAIAKRGNHVETIHPIPRDNLDIMVFFSFS